MTLLIPFTQRKIFLKPGTILLILLAAGAFIRFFGLEYSGLWLDEIYSMLGSDPSTRLKDVYEYSKNDQPPLFFFILHIWLKIFGYTDFAGRSLTCVYGVLGITVMYYLGKDIKNEKLGVIAAFITTINWFHTDISKEIRFYPLVFVLAACSYLFLLRCVKRTRVIDFVWYALFTAMLLNTHYYAMVVFASQIIIFLFVIILFKRSPLFIVGGLVAGGLAGLSLLHWVPIIQHDLQIEKFHVQPVKFSIVFDFAWSYIKDPVAFGVFIVFIFFSLKGSFNSLKKNGVSPGQLVVFGWIFIGFIIPLIYSLVKMPLLTYKYNTITVPAMFLIIANGFVHFDKEKIKSYVILLIALSGLNMLFIARPPYKPRRGEDWREVGHYFGQRYQDKQLTVFSQLSWFHNYYFGKYNLPFPIDQNRADFSAIIKDKHEVWLFLNDRYTGGWPTSGFLPEQQQIIKEEFEEKEVVQFKQTKAILYERKK